VTGPGRPPGQPPGQPPDQSGFNAGYSALGYLLAGLLFWGGAGYLADRWLGTSFLVLIGMLLGGGAALYLIYVRYGKT